MLNSSEAGPSQGSQRYRAVRLAAGVVSLAVGGVLTANGIATFSREQDGGKLVIAAIFATIFLAVGVFLILWWRSPSVPGANAMRQPGAWTLLLTAVAALLIPTQILTFTGFGAAMAAVIWGAKEIRGATDSAVRLRAIVVTAIAVLVPALEIGGIALLKG